MCPGEVSLELRDQLCLRLSTFDLVVFATIVRATQKWPATPLPTPRKLTVHLATPALFSLSLSRDDESYASVWNNQLPQEIQAPSVSLEIEIGRLKYRNYLEQILDAELIKVGVCGQFRKVDLLTVSGIAAFKGEERCRVEVNSAECGARESDFPFLLPCARELQHGFKHASNLMDITRLSTRSPSIWLPCFSLYLGEVRLSLGIAKETQLVQVRLCGASVSFEGPQSASERVLDVSLDDLIVAEMSAPLLDLYDDISGERIPAAQKTDPQSAFELIASGRCLLHSARQGQQLLRAKFTFETAHAKPFWELVSLGKLGVQSSTVEQIYVDLALMKAGKTSTTAQVALNCLNVQTNNAFKLAVDL